MGVHGGVSQFLTTVPSDPDYCRGSLNIKHVHSITSDVQIALPIRTST